MDFRWNEWNIEHIASHGVSIDEEENLIHAAGRPYPRKIEEDKWLTWGQGRGGRFLQVIFVTDENDTIYVIHARPLTDQEKRRLRRRKSR
jgi:uncharacterized DUF497 family protein